MTKNQPNLPASDSDYVPMAVACTKVESQKKKDPRYMIIMEC